MANQKDKNPIVEFLAQPENAVSALQIDEHMTEVKELLLMRFWEDYHRLLKADLSADEIKNQWRLGELPEKMYQDDDSQHGIQILPECSSAPNNVLTFCVDQEHGRNGSYFCLTVCIKCSAAVFKRNEVAELRKKGRDEECKCVEGYPVYTFLWDWRHSSSSLFLRSYAEDHEDFVRPLVSQTIEFVKKWSPDVLKINRALGEKG